jgi:hypothetical protein
VKEAVLFLKKKNQKDFYDFPPRALAFERLGTSVKFIQTVFLCWAMGAGAVKAHGPEKTWLLSIKRG